MGILWTKEALAAMKLLYIANIRLPTEKAHGAQIMKTCEALIREGVSVTLVVPKRFNPIREDPFDYYALIERFPVVYVPTLDFVRFGRLGFIIQSFAFSLLALWYALTHDADIITSRDEMPLWFISFFKRNFVWESISGSQNFFTRRVARLSRVVLVITNGLKQFYIKRGVDPDKIFIVPDGVDLADFTHAESKDESRKRLGIPLDKKVALYIGKLGGWKGTQTLYEAAHHLPTTMQVVIIGGNEEEVAVQKKLFPQVLFLGYKPYRDIAQNEAAADVLVIPNTAKNEESALFTSPLKLFTYMAGAKPIVASDLPSIREILDDTSCCFVAPDDSRSLADGIIKVLSNPAYADGIAVTANALVARYAWSARARNIVTYIGASKEK
jgi:glycosyltransferase involved in cell wall biosynthesis